MKQQKSPPQWMNSLLEKFCDDRLFEGIAGDLLEDFLVDVEVNGYRRAKWNYIFQSIGFLRLIFKKKTKLMTPMRSIWLNYLSTTLRSVKKNKAYFAINLLGLILAITCGWFALVYIQDEFNFDQIHSDKDRTYRLYKRNYNPNENKDHLTYETSGMMAPTMLEEFPEVESFTRFCPWFEDAILSFEETNIQTEHFYFADSNFFEFFDYEILAGNPRSFLTAPSSIVLSESMAKSLFGAEDPMGKVVIGLHDLNYTVTGIFTDVNRLSSMEFDAVVSWSTTVPNTGPLGYTWMNNWLAQGIFSYVKLNAGSDPNALVEKLPAMMERHLPERADQYFLRLVALDDMYLSSDEIKYSRGTRNGSKTFIAVLGFSALLILIIAGLNYINITLSKATQTVKEVGVRKVLGSTRKQLMNRFILETVLSSCIAAVISVAIITSFLPTINQLSGKELPLAAFLQPSSIAFILGFILLISLIVGIYPAWILSAPQVSTIIKGSLPKGGSNKLKKTLLGIQYAISILLIICTLFITRQVRYLENKPLGFDREQVLVIDVNNEVGDDTDVLEAELLKHPNILDVTTSRSAIGAGSYSTTIYPQGSSDEMTVRIFGVDPGFFDVYGISTNQGRTFLRGSIADSANMIVNKAFIDHLGWEDAIGNKMRFSADGDQFGIIGVVDDFHYSSLSENQIEPMVLYLNPTVKWNTSVKIGAQDLKGTIEHIEDTWNQLATRTPLNFFFVDTWFNELYKKERQLFKIATLYAVISILLCALGLYGLTRLQLQQRMKEISIRKVLGASLYSIISMISKQFVLIIVLSLGVMIPVSYYLMDSWLDSFAYRISIDFLPFIMAGVISLIASLTIIVVLSMKTVNTNPANILRTE